MPWRTASPRSSTRRLPTPTFAVALVAVLTASLTLASAALAAPAPGATAGTADVTLRGNQLIRGNYVEARTADVWTGPCFANGEMGLVGKEAVLAWQVEEGAWDGVALEGLEVVAVVTAGETLGDPSELRGDARSVLLVDEAASAEQRRTLASFAEHMADGLLGRVVEIRAAPIEAAFSDREGVAAVRAGDLVELQTRALTHHDEHCGNEIVYYPPLTRTEGAVPAATVKHTYRGDRLGTTWSSPEKRSAFVGTFAR